MPLLTAERYPPDMGYYDYTPLTAPYPMSWPPRDCSTCGAAEIVWAYPVGEVDFPRQISEAGEVQVIHHHAQPWFACARCWPLVDKGEWDQLASEVNKPTGYFGPLAAAKMDAPGYRWARPGARYGR
ncbi:hypothetical protein ACFXCZ_26985 [Streptomyces sp. NPDC059396]|uniref:hypothetical protein n=1 Tax=Streptomyces sp. NPDC059396 TaxID=3346819 RepID=UPI0036889184